TLATQSRKRPGFPFGSVAPYGLDEPGRPTFLISTMAMHTQNLAGDPRASLLVAQPGWTEDPLAGARVTVLGPVERVPAGGVEPEAATMTAIDRLGFRVRARSGDAVQGLRINFPREVRSADAARAVLVEMVRAARGE